MTVVTTMRSLDSQVGFVTALNAAYAQGGNDIAFAVGQAIVMRFPTRIPPGSTINNAYISLEITAKNQAVTGTSYHTLRGHLSGDSPVLAVGDTGVGNRSKTVASTAVVITYPANPSAAVIQTFSVKTILEEILAQVDYRPGAYVTLYLMCDNEAGSDNGIIANNGFFQIPRLIVDFAEPTTDVRYSINACQNSQLSPAVAPADPAQPVPYWVQNEMVGFFVPPANFGTIERDTTKIRIPGKTSPTIKFTTAAPPAGTKATGPTCPIVVDRDRSWIFSGWIWISSAIPTSVVLACEFVFLAGESLVAITGRDQWVPFCTRPTIPVPGVTTLWPTITIPTGYSAGQQIWISEPTIMESTFRQMPFNPTTPEPEFVDYQTTSSDQQSSRIWMPRKTILVGGVPKRVPTWTKRSDDILQLSEPIKGGPQIGQLPAGQTVGGLPAGMTVTELL